MWRRRAERNSLSNCQLTPQMTRGCAPPASIRGMERFAYYMIRMAQPHEDSASDAERVTGVIERLASGEKRTFGNADELLRLVTEWPGSRQARVPSGGEVTGSGGDER